MVFIHHSDYTIYYNIHNVITVIIVSFVKYDRNITELLCTETNCDPMLVGESISAYHIYFRIQIVENFGFEQDELLSSLIGCIIISFFLSLIRRAGVTRAYVRCDGEKQ